MKQDNQMSYAEALKVLNYKGDVHNLVAIRKAWLKMSMKYHPDVNPSPDANKMMASVNSAYERILSGEKKRLSDQLSSYPKEYALLKKVVPFGNTNQEVVIDAVSKIIESNPIYQSGDANTRLHMAADRLISESLWVDFLKSRTRSRTMRSVNNAFVSQDQREIDALVKKSNDAIVQQTAMKAARWVKGKAKVPIVVKRNRKKYVKWVLATAGLIAGIAAGYYGYDKVKNAYYRKKGTLKVIK